MKKKYFSVVASGQPNVGRINIYGEIGDWSEKDVRAADFIAVFHALELTCSRINIHINSPGGSTWEGLPIANAIKSTIKSSTVDVHTYNDGIAYSMAAIILSSAKKGNVHAAKGSLGMYHSASTLAYGNSKELGKISSDLLKYDDVLAVFLERTGKTVEEIKATYFDGEDHLMTATEMLADGLIDVIEDYDAIEMPTNVRNMSYGEVAAWYRGKNNENESNNSENQNHMFNKYSKLSDLAKVAVNDRTTEQFEAVNEQIHKAGVEGVTVVSDSYLEGLENASTENSGLKTKVTDLENSVNQKDAKITELENKVKDLGGKPAEQPVVPVTDKTDKPEAGKKEEVEDFTTDYDREAQKLFGK